MKLNSICLEAIPVNFTVLSGVWSLTNKRKMWVAEKSRVQYSYWSLEYKPPEWEMAVFDLSCYNYIYLTRDKTKVIVILDTNIHISFTDSLNSAHCLWSLYLALAHYRFLVQCWSYGSDAKAARIGKIWKKSQNFLRPIVLF